MVGRAKVCNEGECAVEQRGVDKTCKVEVEEDAVAVGAEAGLGEHSAEVAWKPGKCCRIRLVVDGEEGSGTELAKRRSALRSG